MEPDQYQTSPVGAYQVCAENQSSIAKTETSRNTSGICNQVEMPDSSSSANKSNPVTTASLVSSVCSAFTLSATVKARECVCLCLNVCVCFQGDNRACLSDCVSLIIAVIWYEARA